MNLPKLSCDTCPQNGNGVAEAPTWHHYFTQLPVRVTVIVEKFFIGLTKEPMQES
jgi:hypothetical protein